MSDRRFEFIFIALLALPRLTGLAQSRPNPQANSPVGSLTVTAVVNSSVGLMQTPDGRRQLIIANAPDPKETFTALPEKSEGRISAVLMGEALNGSSEPDPGPHQAAFFGLMGWEYAASCLLQAQRLSPR